MKRKLVNLALIIGVLGTLMSCGQVSDENNYTTTQNDIEALKEIAQTMSIANTKLNNSYTKDAQNGTQIGSVSASAHVDSEGFSVMETSYFNPYSKVTENITLRSRVINKATNQVETGLTQEILAPTVEYIYETYQTVTSPLYNSEFHLFSEYDLQTFYTNNHVSVSSTSKIYGDGSVTYSENKKFVMTDIDFESSTLFIADSPGTAKPTIKLTYKLPFEFIYKNEIYSGTFEGTIEEELDLNNSTELIENMAPVLNSNIYKNGNRVGEVIINSDATVTVKDSHGNVITD